MAHFCTIISAFLFISYSILISFLLHPVSSSSIGQSFRHNLSKHFSAWAKNRHVFLWLSSYFSVVAFIIMLSIVDLFFFPAVYILDMLFFTALFWIFFTISYALDTIFVMKIPLWCSWFFFLLVHLLFIVTPLMSLYVVKASVFLPQLYSTFLSDFLLSHLLFLLVILLFILICLQIHYYSLWGLLFFTSSCVISFFQLQVIIYDFFSFDPSPFYSDSIDVSLYC